MLIKSKYKIKFKAPAEKLVIHPPQDSIEIELYCSRWVASKAFINLCYALMRGDVWESVLLVKTDKHTETVMNKCELRKSMKFLRGHDGGKL